jgi:ParB family transcriptional regulator, chromosome partitioning protein
MSAPKKRGLGRGLEALLGPKAAETPPPEAQPGEALRTLPVQQLQPGKYQPRMQMDATKLTELAESIKAQGVIQPIVVRELPGGKFEIVAGERRWRASQEAGLAEVPVVVRELDDRTVIAMALIENIQREDLNPLEEAQGLQRLIDEFKLTHEQAAQAVGRSRSAATNLLRLLNLATPVQQMLVAGDLDMGHARALLSLPTAQQVMSAQTIVARKLSVREAEKLAGQIGSGRQAPLLRIKKDKPRDIVRLEQQLSDHLTAAVEIRVQKKSKRGEQGEVAIAFGSLDELNGLLEKLGLSAE